MSEKPPSRVDFFKARAAALQDLRRKRSEREIVRLEPFKRVEAAVKRCQESNFDDLDFLLDICSPKTLVPNSGRLRDHFWKVLGIRSELEATSIFKAWKQKRDELAKM